MNRVMALLMLMVVVMGSKAFAQSDTAAYRAATATQKTADRIKALEDFVRQYPASGMRGSAYEALFTIYADERNESKALDAAQRYLETVPAESRMGPYNEIAYALALHDIGIDSALVYAGRAEDMARAQGSRTLSAIQDTRAYALFRHGDAAAAEQLEVQAIKGHEDDPEFTGHLALFEHGNGKTKEALPVLCKALYQGADPGLEGYFAEWLREVEKDSLARDVLKQSIVMATVRPTIDSARGEEAIAARSNAAAFMARMRVKLPAARQWAQEAVASMGRNTPVEDAIRFQENLALVRAAQGEYQQAISSLESIEQVASPWDTKFWMALGRSYEQVGNPAKAIDAYMQGLVVLNPQNLRTTLEDVYGRVHGSTNGLEADLAKLKQERASFHPGAYGVEGPQTDRVVLAELFTGAECGPCVASDLAFDALGGYYPSTKLAILEYHVHIPGPDPLTTNDGWKRFQMYEGGGTPTVVIDGTDKVVGGGPKSIVGNRFNLYRYAIDRSAAGQPRVRLELSAAGNDGSIDVKATVGGAGRSTSSDNPVLNIALVERSVDYTGSNGISRQSYVVRKLLFGPTGRPLSLNQETETLELQVNLADVQSAVSKVIDDPKSQPSWPKWLRNFSGWKSRPSKLSSDDLAVVAWVQDPKTLEVFQAASQPVHRGISAK